MIFTAFKAMAFWAVILALAVTLLTSLDNILMGLWYLSEPLSKII